MNETELKESILRNLQHGEENAIKGKQLAVLCNQKGTRKLRMMIVELRHEKHPIIGGQKGYFLANNLEEIISAKKYLLSYIKDLAWDLHDLKILEQNFNGQLPLKLV